MVGVKVEHMGWGGSGSESVLTVCGSDSEVKV